MEQICDCEIRTNDALPLVISSAVSIVLALAVTLLYSYYIIMVDSAANENEAKNTVTMETILTSRSGGIVKIQFEVSEEDLLQFMVEDNWYAMSPAVKE